MSGDKTPTGMKDFDAMLKRREAIQSSGVPPQPLKEPWMRDEQGYEPDHAAGLAAGFAEVFPKYGGAR